MTEKALDNVVTDREDNTLVTGAYSPLGAATVVSAEPAQPSPVPQMFPPRIVVPFTGSPLSTQGIWMPNASPVIPAPRIMMQHLHVVNLGAPRAPRQQEELEIIDVDDAPVTITPPPPVELPLQAGQDDGFVELTEVEPPVNHEVLEVTVDPETPPTSGEYPRAFGGPTDSYTSYGEPAVSTKPKAFFGALPDGAYAAIVGTWSIHDAELIAKAFSNRNIEVWVPNPENWSPAIIKADSDPKEYLTALVEHEHDGMFQAEAVILDMRGTQHHANDYLLGALAGAGQETFVVFDDMNDNTLMRAKIEYFFNQKSKLTICDSIFDAVLLVADHMDTALFTQNYTSMPPTAGEPVTQSVLHWDTDDDKPQMFAVGVGALVRNEQGQYLGFRRKEGDPANLPFGFMHYNERPIEAAARILADEVGVVIGVDDLTQVHVAWRGRRSGYVAVFGIKSDAIIRKTYPSAAYAQETVWVDPTTLGTSTAYGAFNREVTEAYDRCGTIMATVMDLRGDFLNVSPTVRMAANAKAEAEIVETPSAQA